MIYLVLAVISSALISIFMRLGEAKTSGKLSMLGMNYLMCFIIAGIFSAFGGGLPTGPGLGRALGLGVINGVLYLLGFILFQVNIRKNGVVLSSIFMKLGLLVPIVMSICFFGEIPGVVQIIGFCVAVAAIVLINMEKQQTAMEFKAGLILLLLAGGSADAMSKVYEELGSSAFSEQFLLCTFAVATLLCVLLMICRKERPGKREILYGMLVGIPNYFTARFLLKSLESVSAVIVYPTYSVGTIVAVAIAGVCFFHERLGRRQWLGVGAILVALILLNI